MKTSFLMCILPWAGKGADCGWGCGEHCREHLEFRDLGGGCWLRFNSTPEVFVQFVTVSCHQICCRVVVWCMHALYQNMSIFCVWLLSKCLFAWGWNKHYRERAFVYCTSAWRWRMFRSLKVCYFLVPLTCFSPGCMVCPNRMWY